MHHGDLYRQIVRSLTDGIVSLDLDGTIRFANPSAISLLRAESLEGRHMHEFLDEAGRRHSREHLARAGEGTLLGQVFVIDGKTKISDVIAQAGKAAGSPITLKRYVRFQLGEGIEKATSDFAAEVAAAAGKA